MAKTSRGGGVPLEGAVFFYIESILLPPRTAKCLVYTLLHYTTVCLLLYHLTTDRHTDAFYQGSHDRHIYTQTQRPVKGFLEQKTAIRSLAFASKSLRPETRAAHSHIVA